MTSVLPLISPEKGAQLGFVAQGLMLVVSGVYYSVNVHAGVDAVDLEDLAGDVRAARLPGVDRRRRRARVGGRLAAADHRGARDADRAGDLPGRRAVREAAREAEAVGMIELREAKTDDELELWRGVRKTLLPNERTASVAELRSGDSFLLLAYRGGEPAGSGSASKSDIGGGAVTPRVLPTHRRQGVGTALLQRLALHSETCGYDEVGSMVDDAGSLAFAHGFGFAETGRQVEQVRAVAAAEPWPAVPDGIEVTTVANRPELRRRLYYELALQAFEDMPTPRQVEITPEQWESEWLNWPEATFVALADGEIVGMAGLCHDADRPDRAENALTAVRPGGAAAVSHARSRRPRSPGRRGTASARSTRGRRPATRTCRQSTSDWAMSRATSRSASGGSCRCEGLVRRSGRRALRRGHRGHAGRAGGRLPSPLCGGGALELAVGTGRIAVPLAERGVRVAGIDLSPDMVAELRKKSEAIPVAIGDYATTRVEGTFSLVFIVFNSINNQTTQDGQVATFANAAAHLDPGGSFVVEVGTPNDAPARGLRPLGHARRSGRVRRRDAAERVAPLHPA